MKAIIASMFLSAALCAHAFSIDVLNPSGELIGKYLSQDLKSLRLTGDGAVVTLADGTEESYPAGVFGKFSFDSATAITTVGADSGVSIVGSSIVATGTVALYDLKGTLVREGRGSLSTLGVVPGVYVVKTDGGISKILLR